MRQTTPATNSARPAWRAAFLGGLSGLLLALVIGAPARWLGSLVQWATQHRVQLDDPRGTVWSGSARLVLTGGPGTQDRRSLPGRIAWGWQAAWPGLTLMVSAECCTTQALQWQLLASRSGPVLVLQDQQSNWPMAVLSGLGAPWNTLQAEGSLQWQSTGLKMHWRQGALLWQGHTQLEVQQLTSRLSTLRPMGSYRITLQGSDLGSATPEINLQTLQGPLLLQGRGQWMAHRLRFAGEASAAEGAEAALNNLLNIIGRREGPRSRLSLG